MSSLNAASTAATLSGTAAVAPLTGDVVTIGGTASGTFANKNAGTGKAVTVTGNTISGTDAGNYNLLQQTGLTADISKAALTIMATTNTKTYDGTTAAAALPAITSGSIMSGDSITLAESYTDKNAGSSKMLTPTVTISDGNGGNNYSTNFINDITGVINKASLTITADNNSRIYGDANPVLTGSISGFVNGETLATSGVTGGADYTTLASASSNVGTYNINPNAGTLASGNYSIGSLVNGTLTINKAALSIIADDKTKYSGDFNPLLTATYSGFKLGQNESVLDGTLSLTTTSVQSSPVGDYPIIPSGVTSNNYQISFVNGDLKVIPVYIPQQNALYVTVPDFNGTTTTFIVADDGNGGSLGSDTGDNSQSQKDGQDNGIKTQALPYCN